VTYALTLVATGRDEVFALEVEPSAFGPEAGASLSFTDGAPRIDGPATLLGPSAVKEASMSACGPGRPHGVGPAARTWDVRVPAGTSSTLRLTLAPAPSSPWPTTSYDVAFTAKTTLVDGAAGTLRSPVRTIIDGPATVGRRGVYLTLTSRPRSDASGTRRIARIDAGERIALRGGTTPALRGARVRLYVREDDQRSFHRVRTVRTGRRGTFRATLRAGSAPMQVVARLPASDDRFVAEQSCALAFDVR
jgi:hypothetical protein